MTPQKPQSPSKSLIKPDAVPATMGLLESVRQELKSEMKSGFKQVDARFNEVDAQFKKVDARFDEVDAQFKKIDARFNEVDAHFKKIDARFDRVDAQFAELKIEIRQMSVSNEQQNAKNSALFEAILSTMQRQERLEQKLDEETRLYRSSLKSPQT